MKWLPVIPRPARVPIHEIGERALVAGHQLGKGDRGVVSGLHDEAHEQGLDRNPGSDLDEHPRALHPPGFLAHHHLVGQTELALRHLREDDVARHHLGQAGGLQRLVGPALREHATAVHVDQEVGLCIDLGRLWNTGRLHGGASENQRDSGDESTLHWIGLDRPLLNLVAFTSATSRDCTAGSGAGLAYERLDVLSRVDLYR